MASKVSSIQKWAWGFAAMFLGVYSLDYVPGIMDSNGKMFGLFSMTTIVDIGHLVLGALAVVGALHSEKLARIYFYFLGVAYAADVVTYVFSHLDTLSPKTNFLINLPHTVIFIAAFIIAVKVGRRPVDTPAPNEISSGR
jgi:hypothetical protein